MDRLEMLRDKVTGLLASERPDLVSRGGAHLSYTAALAGLLGMRAGLNVELCQTAGFLHDVWLYLHAPLDEEGVRVHAQKGAELVPLYMQEPEYTREEIEIVTRMIYNHDFHDRVDDPYSEVLKDADMLAHHIIFCRFDTGEETHPRIKALGEALGFEVK